jgi:hypothetical protein
VTRTQRLRRKVERALATRDAERALGEIEAEMLSAWRVSRHRQLLNFGSPDADELCGLIGRQLLPPAPADPSAEPGEARPDIYIASRLYAAGGHTPLIGDYMRGAGCPQARLLVTNMENVEPAVPPDVLRYLDLAPARVAVCPAASRLGKLLWLDAELARDRPARVFLFTHPHDSAAMAACQPRAGRQYVFVHHVDRRPSLGAFLASAIHVDLTPFCFHCCRERLGHVDNRLLPIVASDLGCRGFDRPRVDFRGLTTASSGSADKFRLDYRPGYAEVVAAVLALTGGRHVHIGPLPNRHRERLQAALAEAGVPDERLRQVPWVPSLWRALEEFAIDVYIGSFPLRGARASVEVMGSGTPALWHVAGEASRFHDTHMKYPEAAEWRGIADLLQILRGIDAGWLRRQSQAARRHYEARHHPRVLAACLSAPELQGCEVGAPAASCAEPHLIRFDDLPVQRFEALRALGVRLARSMPARLSAGAKALAGPL